MRNPQFCSPGTQKSSCLSVGAGLQDHCERSMQPLLLPASNPSAKLSVKEAVHSREWWLTPKIPTLGWQENPCVFEASLIYTAKPCLSNKMTNQQTDRKASQSFIATRMSWILEAEGGKESVSLEPVCRISYGDGQDIPADVYDLDSC